MFRGNEHVVFLNAVFCAGVAVFCTGVAVF